MDMTVREKMQRELERTYRDSDEAPPTVNGVIDDALVTLAGELRKSADMLDADDGVHPGSATAIYLRALADDMDPKRRSTSPRW